MGKTKRVKSDRENGNYSLGTTHDDEIKQKDPDQAEPAEKRTLSPKVWQERYDLAYNNQKRMFEKFGEWYEAMYAIKNYKNIAIWKSQVFIPLMSYKAWTMIAKLLAMRPGFNVKQYDTTYSDEDRKRIEKANLKLEHDYDNPMLDESIRDKLFDTATDSVVCGTGFGLASWKSGEHKAYSHFYNDDGTIDYSKSEVTETEYGFNDLDPVDVFDVFAAPGKRNFEDKPWLIRHFTASAAELLTDDDYEHEVVSKLKPTSKNRKKLAEYKQSKNQLIGRTQADQESVDDTVDNFDCFECMEKTQDGIFLVTYAEAAYAEGEEPETVDGDEKSNWIEIRNEKQPYWHNKYPLVPSYIKRRPHDCWGESIFEVTESMANSYNDLFNQLADNLAVVGNGGILMHETSTVIYDFYYAPGGEIRYSGTKPEFEVPESPDIEFFKMMMDLLEGGIDKATISPYASGTPSDGSDNTQGTASGIMRLQEASGEIMTFMKSNFMQFLKGVGSRWLSNNRQFLDEDMTLEKNVNGRTVPYRITPDTFTERMVVTIDEASMQPSTREQQLESDLAWLKAMFELQDRSKQQADAYKAETAAPSGQPVVDPATGELIAPPQGAPELSEVQAPKAIILDIEKISREISARFGKSDFDQYLYNPEGAQTEDDNGDLIAAVRRAVSEGEMEVSDAQSIIDQLEGREKMYANTNVTEPELAPLDAEGALGAAGIETSDLIS